MVVLGEPVEFPFLGATEKTEDTVGQVHEEWEDAGIEQLAAVGATMKAEKGEAGDSRSVPVRLETVATELGTLELYCVERDGPGRGRARRQYRLPQGAVEL